MRVPYSWLQEYLSEKLPPVAQLAEVLTRAGLEVDTIERTGAGLEQIVVAEVEQIEPHPKANHLLVVKVCIDGYNSRQIVTGAQNLQLGLKVPLALPGASLATGQVVTCGRFRGVMSSGMLCSAQELGYQELSGQKTTGVLVLPDTATLGDNVAKVLDIGDSVLVLEVTPDRSDCLSLIGVAREIAAAIDAKLVLPTATISSQGDSTSAPFAIDIVDRDLCPRYTAGLIRQVLIEPSPSWLQQRLIMAGMRPINTVVDVTNYVMLETGQPLHAFDFNKLVHKQIVVRRGRAGETLITLDGNRHQLNVDMLVIADGEKPQALAGIMGGMSSEVTAETNTVLLESASFNNISVRRTAQRLGMRTEASLRYERGVDPNGTLFSLRRCGVLLKELQAGNLDTIVDAYPKTIKPKFISANTDRIRSQIGAAMNDEFIKGSLERLGLRVAEEDYPHLKMEAPTFRPDLEQEADLVEEVARLYGFDRVPDLPLQGQLQIGRLPRGLEIEWIVKDILRSCGLDEVQTYSMTDPYSLDRMGLPAGDKRACQLPLLSPLTREQSVLRTMLIPSLLEVVALNQRHKARIINIFEISPVYLPKQLPPTELPLMPRHLAVVLAAMAGKQSWQTPSLKNDFYRLKGIMETIAEKLGVEARFVTANSSFFHPGKQASFEVRGEYLGGLGEIHPDVADSFDLTGRILAAEIDFSAMLPHVILTTRYRTLPRYPGIARDLALIVPRDTEAAKVAKIIKDAAGPYLVQLELFDVYIGEPIPSGLKSLAYSLLFRSDKHTLTEEEVSPYLETILKQTAERIGAVVRH
ncbi:MAG TPA: phenylalanine--tRNA ligase subunit beta [bacterium]|jgi:phenylalanyl-tRNA synthetase beta chain|nr:phenylalanine--tRNA ligase subunit beta [bacterium]